MGVSIDLSTTTAFASHFSGVNASPALNYASYTDPTFQAAALQLKPGWVRFPSGTSDDAFDWSTGLPDQTWENSLISALNGNSYKSAVESILNDAQAITNTKGPIRLSDFATFVNAIGADAIFCINGFTDTNANSSENFGLAAAAAGVNVIDWELANEAFYFTPQIFANVGAYITAMKAYHDNLLLGAPSAQTSLFYAGKYMGLAGYAAWDTALSTAASPYWTKASVHVYTTTPSGTAFADKQAYQNYILNTGTNNYYNSYFGPLLGGRLIDITETNASGSTDPFLPTLYNGIYLAEFITRLSTNAYIEKIGVHDLYLPASSTAELISAQNDNPGAGQPFGFFLMAPGWALAVINQAVNSSTRWYPTTVTGGGTVSSESLSGATFIADADVPSVYAQAYKGDDSKTYVVLTNKSATAQIVDLVLANGPTPASVTQTTLTSANPNDENSPTNMTLVQPVVSAQAPGSLPIPAYSVTRVEWP